MDFIAMSCLNAARTVARIFFFLAFLFSCNISKISNFSSEVVVPIFTTSLVARPGQSTTKHLLPCRAASFGALSPAAVRDVASTASASHFLVIPHGGSLSSRDAGPAGFIDQDLAVVDEQLIVDGASQILHLLLNEGSLQDLSVQLVQESAKRKVARGRMVLCLQVVELVLVGHDKVCSRGEVTTLDFLPLLQLALKELRLVGQTQLSDHVEHFVGVGDLVWVFLHFELKRDIYLIVQPARNSEGPELPFFVVVVPWVGLWKITVHKCIELERSQGMNDLIAPDCEARLRPQLIDV